MKKDLAKRLSLIEGNTKHLYLDDRFEVWLEKNYPQKPRDYWTLMDIVPHEFHLACLSFAIREGRENLTSSLPEIIEQNSEKTQIGN